MGSGDRVRWGAFLSENTGRTCKPWFIELVAADPIIQCISMCISCVSIVYISVSDCDEYVSNSTCELATSGDSNNLGDWQGFAA